jgi:hypothetical protein
MLLGCLIVLALPGKSVSAVNLVQDGKPTAYIIIPSMSPDCVVYAATELQYHVERSTGATLKIIKEGSLIPSGNHVYLGGCTATEKLHIDPSQLPNDSYIIETAGNDLYIAGKDGTGDPLRENTATGTLFGVYDLLENNMGVKWLWPGKLGEVIPAARNISIAPENKTDKPLLLFKSWRNGSSTGYTVGKSGYSSVNRLNEVVKAESIWLKRQRFAKSTNPDYGHAFTHYWERFGKTHPEYFSMLPDGTRRPEDSPSRVTMSVSEPGLWKQIVEDWKAQGSPEFINCCEDDALARCVCPTCMAWDEPRPGSKVEFSQRLETVKRMYAARKDEDDDDWIDALGPLSDRYLRFMEAVRNEASKIRPDVKSTLYAYENYVEPPVAAKADRNDLVGIVPGSIFPYNKEESESFRKVWGGWAATGCSLFLRPNYTCQGQNFPVVYAHTLGEDLKYAYAHSMRGSDFDCLSGQWAAQGPTLYVIARIMCDPTQSVDKVLDDYYSGFGAAQGTVKEYFKDFEDLTSGFNAEQSKQNERANKKYGAGYASYCFMAVDIYTPQVLSKAEALLKYAEKQTAQDSIALERVKFLEKGLKHAELALDLTNALKRGVDSGDHSDFYRAEAALANFRKTIESDYVSDLYYVTFHENFECSYQLNEYESDSRCTVYEDPCRFAFDAEDKGENNGWFAPGFDASAWSKAKVGEAWIFSDEGKAWKKRTGKEYVGNAWYRMTLPAQDLSGSERLLLVLPMVDGAAKVWVNGKLVCEKAEGDAGVLWTWRRPLAKDITDAVESSKPIQVAVRVTTARGPGGITMQPWLVLQGR